jgi:hypothetical protein
LGLGLVGSPGAAAVLNNLTGAYRRRVEAVPIDDLRRALGYLSIAVVDGLPEAELGPLLMTFGNVMHALYELDAADIDDVIEAYERCREKLTLEVFDAMDRARLTVNLSAAYLSRALAHQADSDFAAAVELGKHALAELAQRVDPRDRRLLAAGANLLVAFAARDDPRVEDLAGTLLANTEDRPQERYSVALNVGNRAADRGDWAAAHLWLSRAVAAHERLRSAIELDARRLDFIARTPPIHVAAAVAAARSGAIDTAVALLEGGRAAGLVRRLRQDLLIRRALASDDEETAALGLVGARLAAPLAGALRLVGAKGVRLVPFGALAAIPWHACPLEAAGADGSRLRVLGDEFVVSYLPSAVTALLRAAETPSELRLSLLGGPDGPELCKDEDAICSRICALSSQRSTPNHLRDHGAPRILHMACHAQLHQQSPLTSMFHLEGADWQLGDLRTSGVLGGTALVVAAACETGRTVRRVPEEVIGLGTGLIECGARAVLATL